MRVSWRWVLRGVLIVVVLVLAWLRLAPHRRINGSGSPLVPDAARTSPLNKPGGGPAPANAYEVYSALYQTPVQEPLAIAQDSVTDIPQVGGSCLKPKTPEEHELTDAFNAANRQSHEWEQKFSIPEGYRLLDKAQAVQVQDCLSTHGKDAAKCAAWSGIKHVRFLGVPGFDKAHTRALVSVVKMCGNFCGSGGVFAVEKTGNTWKRAETTDFTRDCSWMY